MNSSILTPVKGEIEGQIELFSLVKVIGLREGKLN